MTCRYFLKLSPTDTNKSPETKPKGNGENKQNKRAITILNNEGGTKTKLVQRIHYF